MFGSPHTMHDKCIYRALLKPPQNVQLQIKLSSFNKIKPQGTHEGRFMYACGIGLADQDVELAWVLAKFGQQLRTAESH